MSRYLLLLTALLFSLACHKGAPENPTESVYPVTLQLQGFSQQSGEYDKVIPDTLKNHIKFLYYLVFNQGNSSPIRKIVQDSTTANFGIIADTLPAGNYAVTLVGTNQNLSTAYSTMYFGFPGGDAFSNSFNIVVNGPVNQSVSMDRIMAKLEINIKDRIPLDGRKFIVTLMGTQSSMSLYDGFIRNDDQFNLRYTQEFKTSEIGSKDFQSISYFGVRGSYVCPVLTISCVDSAGKAIASKDIDTVRFETGKRTILTGNLFNYSGDGLSVEIREPAWKNDSIPVYF